MKKNLFVSILCAVIGLYSFTLCDESFNSHITWDQPKYVFDWTNGTIQSSTEYCETIGNATMHIPICHLGFGFSESIISAGLINGKIEIVKRRESTVYTDDLMIRDYESQKRHDAEKRAENTNVIKEIYCSRDGKIVLEKTITAKVIPAQEERIEWSE